jgi:hypothetical protein
MPEVPSEDEERAHEKQQAADCSVEYVQSGMVVGLGAGSTAILATRRIGQWWRQGRLRDIVGVPCSSEIEAEARALGIPITPTLLRNFISFYHQAYRAAVWSSRQNFRDVYGWRSPPYSEARTRPSPIRKQGHDVLDVGGEFRRLARARRVP